MLLQSEMRNLAKLNTKKSGECPFLVICRMQKDGELEPGNCSYSTVMCEADKDGGIITNFRDLSAGPSRPTAPWLMGLEVSKAAGAGTPQEPCRGLSLVLKGCCSSPQPGISSKELTPQS